jgi:tRNA modification GTPase
VQARDPPRISRSKKLEDFPRHHDLRNSLESMIRNASSKAIIYTRNVSSHALYPRTALLRKPALIQSRLGRRPSISVATPIIQRNFSSASAIDYSSFNDETIYAVSTAPGRAGIAIVRISGPSCLEVSTLHPRFTDH